MASPALPRAPFDGQKFISANRVIYDYDASLNCWKRTGVANDIPVASETEAGLLSPSFKVLLDTLSKNAGHFGIIARPNLSLIPTQPKVIYQDRVKLAFITPGGSAIQSTQAFEFDRLKENEYQGKLLKFTSGPLQQQLYLIFRNDESEIFLHGDASGAGFGDQFEIIEIDFLNNHGILSGEVEFVSDTLDIACVDFNDEDIVDSGSGCPPCGGDAGSPGLDYRLSEKLLKTFCVTIPGCAGPRGAPGADGTPGRDGTGDGPQGEQGPAGEDAPETPDEFTGIRIEDVDDIFDTAIVSFELDAENNRINIIRAKIRTPTLDDAANRVITSSLSRGITFGDGFEYTLTKPASDDVETDLLMAFYPGEFFPSPDLQHNCPETSQVGATPLSGFIDQLVDLYQAKLDTIAEAYDNQILEEAKAKDDEARSVLANLARDLTDCEWSQPLEFCMGISPEDCSGGSTTVEPSPTGQVLSTPDLTVTFVTPPKEENPFLVSVTAGGSFTQNANLDLAVLTDDRGQEIATGQITINPNTLGSFSADVDFEIPADVAGNAILTLSFSDNAQPALQETIPVSIGTC